MSEGSRQPQVLTEIFVWLQNVRRGSRALVALDGFRGHGPVGPSGHSGDVERDRPVNAESVEIPSDAIVLVDGILVNGSISPRLTRERVPGCSTTLISTRLRCPELTRSWRTATRARTQVEQHDVRPHRRCDLDGVAVTDTERAEASSIVAVDGDGECRADLPHSSIGESTEPLHQRRDGDALHRIEAHDTAPRDRVLSGFEAYFADQAADRRGAGSDERSAVSRDHRVAGKNHHGATADVCYFAPPDFTASRLRRHERAAASRNDARSPHASGSSSGCSS